METDGQIGEESSFAGVCPQPSDFDSTSSTSLLSNLDVWTGLETVVKALVVTLVTEAS